MVTKQGNNYIYDNFKIGVVDVPSDSPVKEFHHVSFTEMDFGDERPELNVSHIFKIHTDQLPAYIEMLQELVGKKAVHMPTDEERRALAR